MSQILKKKFKQVTLSSFVSSSPPKKRKLEDSFNAVDETNQDESKSRKISDPVPTEPNKTEVFGGTITDDGISVSDHIAESTESQDIDLVLPIKETAVPDVSKESVCDMKVDVPTRSDEFIAMESTFLNASLQPRVLLSRSDALITTESMFLNASPQPKNSESRTDTESSPGRKPGIPPTKKLTPKQLQKRQEMEARRAEREKLKQEKEKERLEKEKERLEKKEEKEKKRLAEIEVKNEEKRQKEERKMREEEQRRLKEAEKKAKEDEKQKRMEEIRSREEQEKKKKERTAATFKNFFVPKNKVNVSKVLENSDNPVNRLFMPFEVKENMKLASVIRATLTSEKKEYLDSVIKENVSDDKCSLYLAQLKSERYKPGHSENTWPINLNDDDDVKDDNLPRTRYRCKLLQFNENRRPAYWGTWRKRSKTVSGKTPFKCDSKLEYDVDSDEEWVEEPGESLHGSDDEKESDHEYEVDNDVFVPHGYLSDEEAPQDDEASDQNQTKKLDLLKTEFEAELKEKTFKLKSRSYGCTWIANNAQKGADEIEELLFSFRAVYNVDQTPFSWKSETENVSCGSSGPNTPSVKVKYTTTFPEQFLPDIIRLAHGNKISAKNLSIEFVAYVVSKETDLNLALVCVRRKLKEIAHWDLSKQLWYVRDEIRQQYGLEELPSSENKWIYVTSINSTHNQPKKSLKVNNAVEKSQTATTASLSSVAPSIPKHNSITKFVKVLKPEDREKQLKANLIEKKVEEPISAISPQRTDLVAEPRHTSATNPPFKKRAVLYSVLTPAVAIPVPTSNESLITKVNPVIQNTLDCPVEINGQIVKSETSPIIGEGVEKEPPIVHPVSVLTSNKEDIGKQSNVTTSEEKKKVELPKYVISPQRTNVVGASREMSTIEPPFKKRAVLYSMKPDGNFIATENTPSLIPAVDSTVAAVSQVTKVNPVIQDKLDCNVQIDDKILKPETSAVLIKGVENEPPVEMKTSEVSPASATTVNKENDGDNRRQSNVTIKEGKKYATLISINKARE